MKQCPDCNKEISKKSTYCASCAKKDKRNPNYKNGLKHKLRFCIDCNKKISTTRTTKLPKRCYSCANKGRKLSKLTKQKISVTRISKQIAKGKNNPMFGVHRFGKEAANYIHGKSKEPYPLEFNDELKELIRDRDNHKCQKCDCPEIECNRKLDIHHIDYDKENLNKDNLISLCSKCNLKVNGNRIYWKQYFQKRRQILCVS